MTAPIAITTGEPAGIGPEIAVAAAAASRLRTVLLGDRQLLQQAAVSAGLDWPLPPWVGIEHFPTEAPVDAGRLDARNARYVLRTLDAAIDGCLRGRYRVVLLDEYQDTNPAQRELLRIVFGAGFPVTAVGDADQTIYEWRGARPQYIIKDFSKVLASFGV